MFDVPDEVSAEWAPIAAERGAVVRRQLRRVPDGPRRPAGRARGQCGRHRQPSTWDHRQPQLHHAGHDRRDRRAAREYGLRELVVASYQAASGAGQHGVDTLLDQMSKVAGDRLLGSRAGNLRQAVGDDLGPFPAPLALNVVPWAGSLRDGGWSSEELKVRNESRKILGLPDLKVSATCVRVPVVTGHSLAIHAVFRSEVDADGAREVLRPAPGVILVDDPAAGEFPMPADAVGTDPTWVGRIRRSLDDPRALDLFVTGDNLRKGAALNTAQIAEL